MGWKTVIVCIIVACIFQAFRIRVKVPTASLRYAPKYDYIVVGAGSSGAVVASRLSEMPNVTVLLIEAGGFPDDNFIINTPINALLAQKTELDWGFYTEPQQNAMKALKNQKSYWPRGRVLGGTSSINAMIYTRGSRHDYDTWARNGCDGWAYEDVLPFFLKSEEMQMPDFKESSHHGFQGELGISNAAVTPLENIYMNAAQELGYQMIDYNADVQIGFHKTQSTVKNGRRCSSYDAFIKPIMWIRSNLNVISNTVVSKILIKDKTAYGVEIVQNDKKGIIYADKEIILSAGSVNSPKLLMLSGIGPLDELEKHGITVLADLPVGLNLQDHLLFQIPVFINQSLPLTADVFKSPFTWLKYLFFGSGPLASTAVEGIGFVYSDGSVKEDNRPSDLQLLLASTHRFTAPDRFIGEYNFREDVKNVIFTTPDNKTSFLVALCLQRPKSKGKITLRSTDPLEPPIIDPKYLKQEEDVQTLIKGVRLVQNFVSTPTLQRLNATLEFSPMYKVCISSEMAYDSDAFWECMVRHFALTEYQPTSTCRMGSITDPHAVVDHNLRVKGIKKLRVADSSIIPDAISGNTNAPAIMIGEKVAHMIVNEAFGKQ